VKRGNRSGQRKYERYIEEKARLWKTEHGKKALEKDWSSLRRGWYVGYEKFRDRLLDMLEDGLRRRPATPLSSIERKEHGEVRAQELLVAGLRLLSMAPEDLLKTPKGLNKKRVIVWFIKRNTTASLRWISEALNMGHIMD